LIAKTIGKNNIKPLYKNWNKSGNKLISTHEKRNQLESFTPPQIPSLVTIKVGNKPVSLVIPTKTGAYLVTKENELVKSEPINSSNSKEKLITPPAIGDITQ